MAPRPDSADANLPAHGLPADPKRGPLAPKQYACSHCSYSADKKVSLNRHMRMHTASPPAAAPPLPPSAVVAAAAVPPGAAVDPATVAAGDAAAFVDRYCQDCDIRFSSLKTFRAHKLHYCSTRHVLKGSAAPLSSESAPLSPVDGSVGARAASASPGSEGGPIGAPLAVPGLAVPGLAAPGPGRREALQPIQPLLALPTNPVLLVPYSLLQAASVVSGAALGAALRGSGLPAMAANDAACLLLLPDGSLQPVATAALPSVKEPVSVSAPTSARLRQSSASASAPAPAPIPAPPVSPASVPPTSPQARRRESSKGPDSTHSASGAPLDLSLRRSSDCSDHDEDEKENRSHFTASADHEDIVCAPSVQLILSASSTCSSPSPVPPSGHPSSPPPSRKRPFSPALSPPSAKKSPRRTPNGVMSHSNVSKKEAVEESPSPSDLVAHLGGDLKHLLSSVLASRGLTGLPAAPLPLLIGAQELALRMAAEIQQQQQQHQQRQPPQPPPPQVLVKQGVSKCKECNIVFCKHENYLAHKRHYCQARLQEDAAAEESATSPGPGPGPGGTSRSPSAVTPPEPRTVSPSAPSPSAPTLVQYICALCNIKFTSFDNLTHHQHYYCPKRATADAAPVPMPKSVEDKSRRRCSKCKMSVTAEQWSSHQCEVAVVGTGWRCPCCPVMSPTASAAQRHMETHNGVKAFRCTICRYKGNTLRGMRTHIRMHFEKGLPDLQEENFISCVLDDDATVGGTAPVPPPLATPPTPPTPVSAATTEKASFPGPQDLEHERGHSCDTSPHKGNTLRHMKTGKVHDEPPSSASSNSSRNSEDAKQNNSVNGSERVTIKEEQQDEEFITVEEFKVKVEPGLASDLDDHAPLSEDTETTIASGNPDDVSKSEEEVAANNNKEGPKYCKSCDISFTYYHSFMAHKRFYCSRSEHQDNKVAQASAL